MPFLPRRRLALVAVALLAALSISPPSAKPAVAGEELLVFAAASLKTALEEVAAAWTAETGQLAVISFAGSSRLAKQIEQGAPADLFISANVRWMDVLQDEALIEPASRRDLLRNRLVLVAHGKEAPAVEIVPGFDLAGRLGEERLAMALVDSVPAGIYGKAALTSLGVWEALEPKVAQADNVRAALALVARGEAPFGIVYATDAAADDNVSVVGSFPLESHPPIVYPAAVTAESDKQALGQSFLSFLSSAKARELFERQGFTVIGAVGPGA